MISCSLLVEHKVLYIMSIVTSIFVSMTIFTVEVIYCNQPRSTEAVSDAPGVARSAGPQSVQPILFK